MSFSSYFVTGTDTGVGKTVVSLILAMGLKAKYWKPIQSGAQEGTDSDFVSRWLGPSNVWPEVYRLREPLSPNQAAERENLAIDLERIQSTARLKLSEATIVEGAGGVWVPLNSQDTMLDLMEALSLPVILVARSGLGTLNHTILSVEALTKRSLEVEGLVLVGAPHPANKRDLEKWTGLSVLLELDRMDKFTPAGFEQAFKNSLWSQKE